jgi:hypothetical protein
MFCKSIIKKPYMFRSLLYDHPQGSSFVLSAFTTFRMLASSFAFLICGRMPSMCMCPVYLSVGCLVVNSSRPDNPQTGTPDTYT